MNDIKKTGSVVKGKFFTFLVNKAVWVWWIAYIVIVAVVFLLFMVFMRMLTNVWWVPVVLVLVTGIVWGTVAFVANQQSKSGEKSD